ncbi:hypothetical protein BD309DRAFT_667698 [Dichomitus squalens]|nr:hypothetical protein BD309DRAFT_667698 [Dichomitus squalens]
MYVSSNARHETDPTTPCDSSPIRTHCTRRQGGTTSSAGLLNAADARMDTGAAPSHSQSDRRVTATPLHAHRPHPWGNPGDERRVRHPVTQCCSGVEWPLIQEACRAIPSRTVRSSYADRAPRPSFASPSASAVRTPFTLEADSS